MKIAFVVDSMNGGGTERVISILANNFTNFGHSVLLLFVSTSKVYTFYNLLPEIKTDTLFDDDKNCSKYFSRVVSLRKKIIELAPDIVISFFPHINVYTWLALKRTNIPYVLCERNDPKCYSFIIKVLLKTAFRNADGCVFQSEYAKKHYGKKVDKKGITIYNPFDISLFSETDHKQKTNIIVSVGRLVPQKRFDLLISSFEIFLESNPAYILKIYGEGSLRDRLNLMINDKKLAGKITIENQTKNIKKVLDDADLFVLCSDHEGMPNSLGEALLCGVPSVANDSRCSGTTELMRLFGLKTNRFNNDPHKVASIMSEGLSTKPNQKNREMLGELNIARQWINFLEGIKDGK